MQCVFYLALKMPVVALKLTCHVFNQWHRTWLVVCHALCTNGENKGHIK